jgi:hypothetical protein
MKAVKSLLVAALAAAGMVATGGAQAQSHGGGSHASGGHSGGSHWNGGSHWGGGHGYYGGRYFYGPSVGFYLGAPLLFSPWYWGYPYDYYYPRTVVIDRVVDDPAYYPEGVMPAPPPASTEVPRTQGAPAQAPAYMNFCESAKAYFPKVTSCPEGWKFLPAR